MATITASAAGGKWSEVGAWEGGVVPTSADDVVFAATSGNIEILATAECRSFDTLNYTKTLTIALSQKLKIGSSTSNGGLAMRLGAGMTFTSSGNVEFVSTSGTVETITSIGQNINTVIFEGVGGKWRLENTFTATTIKHKSGELKTNDQEVKSTVSFVVETNTTRVLNLGKSKIVTGKWAVISTTGLTFQPETSTIEHTGSGTWEGGGLTYPNVIIANAASEIVGSNTFAILTLVSNKNTALLVQTNTTQTITTALNGNGVPGQPCKLIGSSNGTWKLKCAFDLELYEIALGGCIAEGPGQFAARGVGGLDLGNNTGWFFDEASLRATHAQGAVADLGSRF